MPMQGKSKMLLHDLYNRKISGLNDGVVDGELIFSFLDLRFYFERVSSINSEKVLLVVEIASEQIKTEKENYLFLLAIESYLLGHLSKRINELSESFVNVAKSIREKAQFSAQEANQYIIKRNGFYYDKSVASFVLKINFNVPLLNAISINAKSTFKAVKEILSTIREQVDSVDYDLLNKYVDTYKKQLIIRKYLEENNYVSFIANGSILPRDNNSDKPLLTAIPFLSPKDLEIKIDLGDKSIKGMGIKKGITIITGGGYSGKSTILDAIEDGIYNHIPYNGKEFVITNSSAIKIYAEDGRPVLNEDLRLFFKYLPNCSDLSNFHTSHASGSVSQATSIIEAIYGGSKLLLIDEDKSATNFMIRDKMMRCIVKKEPIIPFTDRVEELNEKLGVSTILVIGGSSEYFKYADTILIMEDYKCKNKTNVIKDLIKEEVLFKDETIKTNQNISTNCRYLVPKETNQPFLYFKSLKTENNKYICLDDYISDITYLTQIKNSYQINMLACLIEMILVDKDVVNLELKNVIEKKMEDIYLKEVIYDEVMGNKFYDGSLITTGEYRWYEEVRAIDVMCALNRMRGLTFKK